MTITPRDLHFDFSSMNQPWIKNNPFLAHMFNAPSLGLPYMEGFVNYVAKRCMGQITDKKLLIRCLDFIQQETFHAREHVKYNQKLKEQGYSADGIIEHLKINLSHIKNRWSLLSLLAVGVGFECLTAVMSKTVIEDHVLAQADREIQQFWCWHMQEELEHRSVLFDLYRALGGGYCRRTGMYTLVIIYYCYYTLRIYLSLLKRDKAPLGRGLCFTVNKKSFFRKSIIKSLKFYRFKYHPSAIRVDAFAR